MELKDLEALCDKHGNAVLEMLASMCHEKAEHVRQYSDSEALSRAWTKAATQLYKVHFPY